MALTEQNNKNYCIKNKMTWQDEDTTYQDNNIRYDTNINQLN
jgi:hypothetical protein